MKTRMSKGKSKRKNKKRKAEESRRHGRNGESNPRSPKIGVERAMFDLDGAIETAGKFGIEIVYNRTIFYGTESAHVMFNWFDTGRRLANWWPGTGLLILENEDKDRRVTNSIDEALGLVLGNV